MPIEQIESIIERSPWNQRWFSFALGAAVAVANFFYGSFGVVPTYFVLPVMLLAWNWGTRYALGLGVALTLSHLACLYRWGLPGPVGVFALGVVMRFSVLVVLALITARLGSQTRASRERVKMLEGILPICAYCKDIRDEDGQWQPIEAYVSQHSEANFSHGICAKCTAVQVAKYRADKEKSREGG